jgi:uncharacterized protein YbbC (DUF1343 family)
MRHADDIQKVIRGRKAGVLTNGSFWLEDAGDSLAGVVKGAASETVLLYGEHGGRGDEGPDAPHPGPRDAYTGCEIRSVYEYERGAEHRTDAIADRDVLLVGLHDIGCRHYSYKRTMCYLMEIAARAGKPVVVVDAPNPVGGDQVEGNLPDPDFYAESEIGKITPYCWFAAPITYRHGMTMGELALMAKAHLKLDLDLRVIKMEGWRREMQWEDAGWPYVPFDPSINSPETTRAFLCTGLFQGTSVAWGIGTADSFRVIGAPWIKDDRLLRALQRRNLSGVTWTRAFFIPRWPEPGPSGLLWRRFFNEPCNGVRLHFTGGPVRTAEVQLSLLVEMCRLYPEEFTFAEHDHFDCRLEDKQWRARLKAGEGVDSMLAEWQDMSKRFEEMRRPYLLYT